MKLRLVFLIILTILFRLSYGQNNIRPTCTDSTVSDIKESISFYEGRLSIDSTDQVSYYKIGMCYYKLKIFSAAISYFDKLIQLNPNYPGALSNRGICKLLTKQTDKAIMDFKLSIKYGQDPQILSGLTLSEWIVKNTTQ
jgi:tetratricopeptide (TPR) repeat protein